QARERVSPDEEKDIQARPQLTPHPPPPVLSREWSPPAATTPDTHTPVPDTGSGPGYGTPPRSARRPGARRSDRPDSPSGRAPSSPGIPARRGERQAGAPVPAPAPPAARPRRSEEHTSELQSRENIVCRLLLE